MRYVNWPRVGAPKMDLVFSVCDNAVKERCPYWPGQPMTAQWGFPIRLP